MRATRAILIVIGVVAGLNGLWQMRDFHLEQLRSMVFFLVGGLIVHDGILAPITIAVCFGAARFLPSVARKPATVALIIWGTLTVVTLSVLSGEGGKPDNDTILVHPYRTTWLIMTTIIVVVTLIVTLVRQRQAKHAVDR